MLDSFAALYDSARDRVNWNRAVLFIVDDEQVLSSGPLALDYLGLDPDRDRHPLHRARRPALPHRALETGRAPGIVDRLDLQRAAQEKRLHAAG